MPANVHEQQRSSEVSALRRALFEAVDNDDPEKFEAAIVSSPDCMASIVSLADAHLLSDKQESLLCYALNRQKLQIARYLIEKQADVNLLQHSYLCDDVHNSALTIIAENGYAELFELSLAKLKSLLTNHEQLTSITRNYQPIGRSPTVNIIASSAAPESQKQRMLKALINVDANVVNAAREDDGNTPLHVAVGQDNLKVIKLLIKNQADPFLKNKNNQSPLCNVAKERTQLLPDVLRLVNKQQAVEHLCNGLEADQLKRIGLYLKQKGQLLDIAEKLITYNPASTSSNPCGQPSLPRLHEYVKERDIEKLKQLIADGRKPEVCSQLICI